MAASVAVLNALAIIASDIPSLNPATPLYAVVASDTLIPLTVPSSWGEFSPRYETQVSDYPVENGAFALYNKVRRPQTVYVSMTKTGSDLARFSWLAAIRQAEANNPLQLYTLISPQDVFVDYTLTGLAYETRPDRGSNILRLYLTFTQVPQINSSTGGFTNPLEPSSGPVQQLGQLFTQVATLPQTALANASAYITG
jgi:hypothetical protein